MTANSNHIITSEATIGDALLRLNSLTDGNLTIVAVDADNRLRGTVTDGDIRRALLKGLTLSAPVTEAVQSHCITSSALPQRSRVNDLLARGIKLLPIVDAEGRLVDLVDLRNFHAPIPVSALIMAGGKGERLRPATLTTPKPLLEINGRPIIDYVVERLRNSGIEQITVACRYLAEQLIAHFSGSNVKCIVEQQPLGTIGALSMMAEPLTDYIVVMNCDLLTTIDISEMLDFLIAQEADVAIATVPYTVQVPYAILETEGTIVKSLQEKPSYTFYANAGIYLLHKSVIDMIQPDKRIDAPELIERAINSGKRVVSFPLKGTWVDIGTPADFSYAQQLLNKQ